MPFCSHCGSAVDGGFCPACGKPIGAAGASPAGTAAGGMADNVAGALCYLAGFITGILFLVLEPYNKKREIRFHAFQSIFLNIAWIAAWIVSGTFAVVAGTLIPFIGSFIAAAIPSLAGIGFLVVWVVLMVKTFNGQKWVLPVIGPMAEKQAG